MQHQIEKEIESTETITVEISVAKKCYRSPELRHYGDFNALTQGGGGTKNEPHPGNPSTKV